MQKLPNNFMNTKVREFFSHGLLGGIWISFGILRLLPSSISLLITQSILLLIGLIGQLMVLILQSEIRDEMTKFHEQKAFTIIMLVMSIFILIFTMISTLKQPWFINLTATFPFILGFANLGYYILFMYLEKYGD